MNTTPLPILTGAAPVAPARNSSGNGSSDGVSNAAQFSQALSRELGQRQQTMPAQAAPLRAPAPKAPAPAAKAPEQNLAKGPAKASEGDEPARPAPAAPAQAGKEGAQAGQAKPDASTQDAGAPATASAASPVADMLALVAAFNQPAAAAPAAAAPVVADTLGASSRTEATTLAGQLAPAARVAELPGAADNTGNFALPPSATLLGDVAQPVAPLPSAVLPVMPDTQALPGDDAPGTGIAQFIISNAEPQAGLPKAAIEAMPVRSPALDAQAGGAQVRADAAQFASQPVAGRGREQAGADTLAISDLQAVSAPAAPLQQATAGVANAAPAAALADKLAARVGTPAWDNQLGQKIVYMVTGKEQTASMTLNPPDMGPMQIVLSVNNDMASVTFTAAQPEVRQALENAMPKLREMMSESGIELGNASVNAGSPDQRQAQGETRSGGQGGPGQQASGDGRAETNGSATDAAARAAARPRPAGERPGLVDTFA